MKTKLAFKFTSVVIVFATALLWLTLTQSGVQSVDVEEARVCDGAAIADVDVDGGANTGSFTSNPTIDTDGDAADEPHGNEDYFLLNPTASGGAVNNNVEPNTVESEEERELKVTYRDSGATEMLYELQLDFEQENDEDYTVTWNNFEIAAKWEGDIDLPQPESGGEARWRAYTWHPWDGGQNPQNPKGSEVAVHINDGGSPSTEWHYDGDGPISENSGMVVLEDPDPTAPPGLASEFEYEGDGDGIRTVTCMTAIRVILEHHVDADYVKDDVIYTSESGGLSDGDGWDIYGWKIRVEITSP